MARFRSLAMNKHARTGNFLTKIDEQIDRVSEAINREMKAVQLSSISDDLGDIFAGRFIAPSSSATSAEPTDSGFTGSFVSSNGETFDGTDYHVGAVAAGVLGVGFNTAGQLLWGAGNGILDVDGLYIAADSVSGGGANPNKIRLGSTVTEIFALYDTGEAYHRQNTGAASSDLADVLHQAVSSSGTAYVKLYSGAAGVYVDVSPTLKVDGTTISPTYAVRKAADESVTSSEVLQNDDELLFACAADSFYAFEFFLICNAAAAGDFTFGWSTPAGATMKWQSTNGLIDVIASGTPATALVESDTLDIGAGAGTDFFVVLRGIIDTSSTAGNLTLKWAQRASNGTASKILANSYVTYRKIG